MTDFWNAKIYSKFLDLRTRPARDLLSAIPAFFQPKSVYDLGCGPGNSTILLKERWPEARVVGLDSSANMLKSARGSYLDINFIEGNIAHFSPEKSVDFLFANASLQWLPAHDILLPKLLNFLNPGGALAIQMPNNFHCPSHQVTLQLLKNNPVWQPFLKKLLHGEQTTPFYKLHWYYDVLSQAGAKLCQLWETEYYQEMADHQDVFDWLKGTGLRPVLSTMDMENQAQFNDAYVNAIATEYPLQANNKVLLPFRRVFMVGFK